MWSSEIWSLEYYSKFGWACILYRGGKCGLSKFVQGLLQKNAKAENPDFTLALQRDDPSIPSTASQKIDQLIPILDNLVW